MKARSELSLSKSPKSQLSACKIKKIEMRSWKGLRELGSPTLSLGEKYAHEQDQAILGRSIESFDLYNKAIVNVGGGNGREAEFLIKKGARNVIIADIAVMQLLSAKNRKERHGLNGLKFVQVDVDYLPFKEGAFDLCYVFMALHHFPNHRKSIAEICRVIKYGVIIVDIMESQITRILNFFGLFSREWCGIEPHRLCEKDVKIMLRRKGIKSSFIYLLAPPYNITKNRWMLRFIRVISKILNYVMQHSADQRIGHLFGNVGIVIGRRMFHPAHSRDELVMEGASPATSFNRKAVTER